MEFTINTKQDEKVTTLFLDEAEPIVKRYKFIKGYKGGSLDYSSLNFRTFINKFLQYMFI